MRIWTIEREQEGHIFQKLKVKLGTVAHACNVSTWKMGGERIGNLRQAWATKKPVSK